MLTQEEIFNKYPNFFVQKDLPKTLSCMCWGLSHGKGWYGLIDDLCGKIQTHYNKLEEDGWEIVPLDKPTLPNSKSVWALEFTQIKSKWGLLPVYYMGGDDEVERLIDEAEDKSQFICENCGAPSNGVSSTRGWLSSYCTECREK